MYTPWIVEKQLRRALARNEAFWEGALEEGPLLWVTVAGARPGSPPVPRGSEEEQWTDVDYVMEKAEDAMARTSYAADALPVHNPWLGPDQFAAWLGADLTFRTADNTSWAAPFIDDWESHSEFRIDPENRWWKAYLSILRASVERGKGKWITAYPDLHTGIDALGSMRGPENLMVDLLTVPGAVKRAMSRMTVLWKEVIDVVSSLVLPAGQGTSNWTMGWSDRRFVCIGQNDFSCLIGPSLFDEFVLPDTVETARHVDRTIYHLDGPGALKHLPRLLAIEALDCIQWIQGAGAPLPSEWTDLLKRIQQAGKTVQLFYGGAHGGKADFAREIDILCSVLDPARLFLWADVDTVEKSDFMLRRVREACREGRARPF